MTTTFRIVTTPQLEQTERVSFKFLVHPGVPRDFICDTWGIVTMRRKDDNEINPFKLARGEPGAIGDDGVKRWDIHLFTGERGNICSGGVDESSDEGGLRTLLRDATEGIDRIALLMEKDLLDRFTNVCNALGIEFQIHECSENLSTS